MNKCVRHSRCWWRLADQWNPCFLSHSTVCVRLVHSPALRCNRSVPNAHGLADSPTE